MKLQILSDLHFEFYEDGGKEVLSTLDPSNVDVLVLAGDLATIKFHDSVLNTLAERFPEVIFILGNHDYYGSSPKEVHKALVEICAKRKNLHWLHNTSVVLHGQRFVGTPLWFQEDPMNPVYQRFLNDFRQIRGFQEWVYEENKKAMEFLHKEVTPKDIVITHHVPSLSGVHERFLKEPLNRFFVCNMEKLIQKQNPRMWIFGHTHECKIFSLGGTSLVCNPRGYMHEAHENFDPKMVFEIGKTRITRIPNDKGEVSF